MTIGSYAKIKYLDFEDCPNLDSYAICKACFDANSPLVEAIVKGVNWSVDDMKFLTWLADKGVKLQGKITCTTSVTMDQKRKMLNAWGKLITRVTVCISLMRRSLLRVYQSSERKISVQKEITL